MGAEYVNPATAGSHQAGLRRAGRFVAVMEMLISALQTQGAEQDACAWPQLAQVWSRGEDGQVGLGWQAEVEAEDAGADKVAATGGRGRLYYLSQLGKLGLLRFSE